MFDRLTKIIFSIILTAAVIVGGYIAYQRHNVESASKTVELTMDWRDLQILSALSKYPIGQLLDNIKNNGITSIGVFEETLSDANNSGEIYYSSGAGVLRLSGLNPILSNLVLKGAVKPENTYIYCEVPEIRKRIIRQLKYILPKNSIKNLGEKVLEVNESAGQLKDIGIGISEITKDYLTKKGFSIIPRVANEPRYNVPEKIAELSGFKTIIFDGDKILGYPDNINFLAVSMKNNNIKYGAIEIIKQDGDKKLKQLLGEKIVRAHSIPKDELLKTNKDEALVRFTRAAKERTIRLIYIRPYLPPQINEDPVKYNLQYLSEIKLNLEKAGFTLGQASSPGSIYPYSWGIIILGTGVIILTLLLIDLFVPIPWFLMWIVLIISIFPIVYIEPATKGYFLEKTLALLAAIVAPSYAIISQYGKKDPILRSGSIVFNSAFMLLNVITECAIGIFLIVGLLSNTKFMLGAFEFSGIKMALILPILILIAYFMPRSKEKWLDILNQNVKVYFILIGIILVGVFGVFLARSGNFSLPVPGFEKQAREILELVLGVRPRTKEFLIGYPILMAAGILFLKNKKDWLWLFLAVGAVGPISLINSFTHIHSPVIISMIRSINGLVLGLILGAITAVTINRYIR